jgi:predicted ribosomally synthesized six-cysteine peptide SCIFF
LRSKGGAMKIKVIKNKPFINKISLNCRECPTPCKSACKTSMTVGNQTCEKDRKEKTYIF